MNKLIPMLTVFASLVMPGIGGEPIGKASMNAEASDQDALILRILRSVDTHDYRTLLIYTLDKETDYFDHKNVSSAFIQQDMMQDYDFSPTASDVLKSAARSSAIWDFGVHRYRFFLAAEY
jgi:hypothetical protein